MNHKPVLTKEVINYLGPKRNENFIDATFGFGGHTKEILKKNRPNGKILGIEKDPEIYKKQLGKFPERVTLVNSSYKNIKEIAREKKLEPDGILFDLGMSSWHIDKSNRGFSFKKQEPLDMRYNPENDLTALEIVNKWDKKRVEEVLRDYGDEKYAKQIAEQISKTKEKKPIRTTGGLLKVLKKSLPAKYLRSKKIHFATRTFQALRIAVNEELKNLGLVLPKAMEILKPKGRLVLISFHSGEDRIVKNFFKEKAKKGSIKILTKKPVTAAEEEIQENPRSRSAKLRAGVKIK